MDNDGANRFLTDKPLDELIPITGVAPPHFGLEIMIERDKRSHFEIWRDFSHHIGNVSPAPPRRRDWEQFDHTRKPTQSIGIVFE